MQAVVFMAKLYGGIAKATLLTAGGEKAAPPVIKYVEKSVLEQNQVLVADEL